MIRWTLPLSLVCLLSLHGCGGADQPAATDPQEPAATAGETEIVEEEVEEVVVIDPAPAEPAADAPTENDAAESPEEVDPLANTPARPSVLLNVMLQPMNIVIESTMAGMQRVAAPLTSGGLLGGPPAPTEVEVEEQELDQAIESAEDLGTEEPGPVVLEVDQP